jgi:multiple sugar transport system permease protein
LGYAVIAPVVLLLSLLLAYPVARSFQLSFWDLRPTIQKDAFIGLDGFANMFGTSFFSTVLINSVLWTVVVVTLQFGLGMIGALVLNRRFPGRWLVRIIAIIPWAIPGVVAAMVWRLLYNPQIGTVSLLTGFLGIPPTDYLGQPTTALWGVIIAAAWKGFGFWMLILLAALQSVDREQIEAAVVDGAGRIQVFRYVAIPSMAPVLRVGFILTSIWTFNYFEMVYVMTRGGPIGSSHIFPTAIYEEAFHRLDFGDASRFAVVSIVIMLGLSVLFVREARRTDSL